MITAVSFTCTHISALLIKELNVTSNDHRHNDRRNKEKSRVFNHDGWKQHHTGVQSQKKKFKVVFPPDLGESHIRRNKINKWRKQLKSLSTD